MEIKTIFRLRATITIVLIVIVIYSVVMVVASIGRFSNTHAITVESYCVDCHLESLTHLENGDHIGAMSGDQSVVINNYYEMINTTTINNSNTNGLCMSCHNVRAKDFGLIDPYISTVASGNGTYNISTINGITFWDGIDLTELNITNENPTESIVLNIKVQDVAPVNSAVIVDATVQLMNFSGVQNQSNISRQCICNETDMTIIISNIYADYFKVYLDVSGQWNFSSLNISVNGYPSETINIFNGSLVNFYTLPADLPLQYSNLNFFHTIGNYKVGRMDEVIEEMRNFSVTSITLNNELMKNNIDNTSNPSYTCGSTDTLCHINQRIINMGQEFGIRGERYYSHDMEYSTNVCRNCHI